MTTSKNDIGLSEPVGAERVPPGTLGYFQARNRHNVYDVVVEEFENSGLSQADLARRLGKGPDVVCRLLGGPGNWTLDTVSDLMFAISGAAPVYNKEYPLKRARRNQVGPDWLHEDVVIRLTSEPKVDTTNKEVRFENRGISVTAGSS
jgi:hypothetical protein